MNKLILSALVISGLSLSACHHAIDKSKDDSSQDDGVAFPQSSSVLSKWLRSNVGDYWRFARENSVLSNYASSVGVVVGDAHLANFAPIPVKGADGTSSMAYLDIDFDDAGEAPFALDLLRLVATSKATKLEVKTKDMVAAYIKGLRNEPVEAPAEIRQYLNMSADDYRKLLSDDLDSKTNSQGFKMKPGKIEKYEGPLTRADLQAMVPTDVTVLDIASRPVDDGGNLGGERIWIYGKDSSGLRRLFELKAYSPTELSAYQTQREMTSWAWLVRNTLWSHVATGEYELASRGSHGIYWFREKKLTLIDIPYSSNDKSDVNLVKRLAVYDAFVLGNLHASQPSVSALRDQLSTAAEQEAFAEAIKLAAKAYLADVASRL